MSNYTNELAIEVEEEKEEVGEDLEKLSRADGKLRQVETRRSIEDFLWRRAIEKRYEDPFGDD